MGVGWRHAPRLVKRVKEMVDRRMPPVIVGPPPIEAQEFAREMRHFATSNWKTCQLAIDDDGLDDRVAARDLRRLRNYEAAWDDFLSVWNGWIVTESNLSVTLEPHYTDDPACDVEALCPQPGGVWAANFPTPATQLMVAFCR